MCPENEVPPGGPPGDISEDELKKILGEDYAAVVGPPDPAEGAAAAAAADGSGAADGPGADPAGADGASAEGTRTSPEAAGADAQDAAAFGADASAAGGPAAGSPSDPSMSDEEAEEWARRLEEQMEEEARAPAGAATPAAMPGAAMSTAAASPAGWAAESRPPAFAGGGAPASFGASIPPASPVQPVHFAQIEDSGARTAGSIDVLLDVKLPISVELGRTEMEVKEILQCAPGTVIELHKLAGEPVDVFINGRMVAQGEVVVVDEHFGVRVTSLLSPGERVRSLA